ncbi:phage head closure protein [Bacteroides sp.]|uniref:phage head closure protein n=1 Tax=Bacteroides sp. TaxID=29523 RepID=UPI00260D061F|nr:phage head closure protein [Bacteroides sp.]MDD3038261.1 phage head closure protein [Bacteroides sp.]
MQAGLLNEIITFFRSESKRDNLGGTSEIWVKAFDKRAYIRFKSGARKEANGEIYNTTVNTMMIRICKDINAKMRIGYNGQKYKILSINHDRKQQSITIEAEVINE